jgi:hypothetical protein
MARLSKRTKPEPVPQTDAVVGRDLIEHYRKQSEEQADKLTEGEACQYWDDGWRYGHIEKLPDADEPKYGQVRIVHQVTGRVWVPARDVKPMNQEWEQYFAWRRE